MTTKYVEAALKLDSAIDYLRHRDPLTITTDSVAAVGILVEKLTAVASDKREVN